jgi:hypothetical protein
MITTNFFFFFLKDKNKLKIIFFFEKKLLVAYQAIIKIFKILCYFNNIKMNSIF